MANVKLWPSSFNVYDSLGEAYLYAGKYKLAREKYIQALTVNPQSESSLLGLGKAVFNAEVNIEVAH